MADDCWEKVKDDSGEVYWWNPKTNESRWDEPSGFVSNDKSTRSFKAAPPPPKRIGGVAGSASPSGAAGKLGNLVSAGQNMVKSNSMRLKTLMKKDEPRKDAPPAPTQANGNTPPSNWEARRKKSFQAAIQAVQGIKSNLTGQTIDPSTIDGHIQLQAKEQNRQVEEIIQRVDISKPYEVKKQVQVSFDEENISFSGLPEGWAEEAHKQYGVPLQTCPRTQVDGYSDRIPIVLIKLKQRFIELGGLEADGIFRLAPDGQDVADAKMSINAGQALKSLARTKDPHVVANLIKQFFRELKPKVLNAFSKEELTEMSNITDLAVLGRRLQNLPDPQRSSFFWLLDLLSEVATNEDINRMTPTNLAIVLSPNLFDAGPGVDPYQELLLSQRVAAFTSSSLKWRIAERKGEL